LVTIGRMLDSSVRHMTGMLLCKVIDIV